jgi:hypothetical protein
VQHGKINLTLTVEAELLKRARIQALEQGTSVNAIVREHLERFAGEDRAGESLREFLAAARRSTAGGAASGRAWTRAELYDRHGG